MATHHPVFINAFPDFLREAARTSPDRDALYRLMKECMELENKYLVAGTLEAHMRDAGEEDALVSLSVFYNKIDRYLELIRDVNIVIFGAGPSGLTLASACDRNEALVLEKRSEAKYARRYYILFFRKATVEKMKSYPALRDIQREMISVSKQPWDTEAGTIVPAVQAEGTDPIVGFVTRLGDLQVALRQTAHANGNDVVFESTFDMDKLHRAYPDRRIVDATGGRGRHEIKKGEFGGTVTLSSRLTPDEMKRHLRPPRDKTRYFCVPEHGTDMYTYYFGLRISQVQYQAFRRHRGYLPMLVFHPDEYFAMLDEGIIEDVQQNVHIVVITPEDSPLVSDGLYRIGDARRSVDFFTATGATKGVEDALELARKDESF